MPGQDAVDAGMAGSQLTPFDSERLLREVP